MTKPKPTLSVVVTSYTLDRLNDIIELLDSIKAQSYDHTETILVIERSVELFDRIKHYVGEKAIPNVNVVFNHGEPGLSAARNLGIKEARGDIIAFIDDDALPFPDWAEEMVRTYKDDSVIGTTGPALPLWEDESMIWFPEELYWIIGCTAWYADSETKGITPVRNVWGMNMSFRREAFDLAGTFSSDIGGIQGQRLHGEEVDLSLRVKRGTGKCIVYNPKVKVQHKTYKRRLSSRFIARNSYWIGCTRPMLKRIYPKTETDTDLLSTEYQLLKRIFFRLLPNILKGFFTNPIVAWRKLRVTVISLFFVTIGYSTCLFQGLFSHREAMGNRKES